MAFSASPATYGPFRGNMHDTFMDAEKKMADFSFAIIKFVLFHDIFENTII